MGMINWWPLGQLLCTSTAPEERGVIYMFRLFFCSATLNFPERLFFLSNLSNLNPGPTELLERHLLISLFYRPSGCHHRPDRQLSGWWEGGVVTPACLGFRVSDASQAIVRVCL